MTYDYWQEKDGSWALAYSDDGITWTVVGYEKSEKDAEYWYCKKSGYDWR